VDLPTLARTRKSVIGHPEWVARDDRWFALTASIDVDGVAIAGLTVRGSALRNVADSAVCFQLQYQPGKIAHHLIRVDWKPIKPHTNSNRAPPELRFLQIYGSHVHKFEHNYLEREQRMFAGNQPTATPILEDLDSFEKFVAFCGIEFNMADVDRLPAPPWAPRML